MYMYVVVTFHCISRNDQVTNQNEFFMAPEVLSSEKNKNTRNVLEENANDNNYCKLCELSFKLQFGNLSKPSHSSSENPFKPSEWKDCFVVVLSKICCQVGLPLTQDLASTATTIRV